MAQLNGRQRAFVDEYLVDLNATQAAIRTGYSRRSASSIGEENLRKPEIKSAIDKAMVARSQRVGITADQLLKRIGEELDADIADLFDEEGKVLPPHQWPPVWRRGLVLEIDRRPASEDELMNDGPAASYSIKFARRTGLMQLALKHVPAAKNSKAAKAQFDAMLKEFYEEFVEQSRGRG